MIPLTNDENRRESWLRPIMDQGYRDAHFLERSKNGPCFDDTKGHGHIPLTPSYGGEIYCSRCGHIIEASHEE